MNSNRSGQHGAAAVEFAIVLIPLLMIVTGITEFGRAMYYYNTLAKAARDAARLVATKDPADLVNYPTFVSHAKCLVAHGNSSCNGQPLLPGLTTAMFRVYDRTNYPGNANVSTGSELINLVTVSVEGYRYESLAPFLPLFGMDSVTFAPISATMRQDL